jgi:hypothetical protein
MSRVGLGRHGQIDSDVGDPLDGLVNLFDVGLVLAVAFLVAGLGLSINKDTGKVEQKPVTPSDSQRTLRTPKQKTTASGQGEPVGRVYRLPDGRLVLDAKK